MVNKFLMLTLTALVAFSSFSALKANVAHSEYINLKREIWEGREALSDLYRLQPYIVQRQSEGHGCDLQVRKTAAFLSLYASDLAAKRAGVRNLREAGPFSVQVARATAMRRVRDVVVCAPFDGDMWFRLAQLSLALKAEPSKTETYLAWSVRTAPHENWIKAPRKAFADRNLGSL